MTKVGLSKLMINVLPETLMNLRRHSLTKAGSGPPYPIGRIVDELVKAHIPDYVSIEASHSPAPSFDIDKDGPRIVHES